MKKVDSDKKSKVKKFRATVNSVLQKDVEFEDADISASEDEEDDTRKHQKLLEAVQKLKGQKPTKIQRSEASQDISEFNLTEVGKEKVKLNELIKTLKQTTSHVSIKQQLKKVTKKKILHVPLSKPQADKIKRTIAYSKVAEEVSKWDRVVKSNRSAEQIIYPLNQPEFHLEATQNFAKRFRTKTPLEEEVAELLRGSEHTLDQEKEFTPAEEKALEAMSLEEARNRHKELQKMRALLSYKEAKARRMSKIKSKKYHRILKKEKMKTLMKEFEEFQKNDPGAAQEKLKELDKQRILERMTLKHKSTGKWAKYQKIRAKYDPESRAALKQQLELSRALAEKITVPDELVDTVVNVAALGEEERQNLCDDAVLNLYSSGNVSQSCELTKLPANKIRESETPVEKSPDVVLALHLKSGAEEAENDSAEEEIVEESLKRKKSVEDFEDTREDAEILSAEEKMTQDAMTQNILKKRKPIKRKSCVADVDLNCQPKVLDSIVSDDIIFGCDDIENTSADMMNIQQAFADEDFINEFKEEKKAVQKREQPEGVDLFLPGWGSWGGMGIKPSRRKKRRFFIKAPIIHRRDDTLGNVIINEDKDKKAAAHQVSELPFPFNSVHQFQSIIRQPIGNTWNPETSFKNMIAPKVVTKPGKIIEPIDADALVLQKNVDQKPSRLLKDKLGKLPLNQTQGKVRRHKRNQKKSKLKPKLCKG